MFPWDKFVEDYHERRVHKVREEVDLGNATGSAVILANLI